jgi:hypothetical protein
MSYDLENIINNKITYSNIKNAASPEQVMYDINPEMGALANLISENVIDTGDLMALAGYRETQVPERVEMIKGIIRRAEIDANLEEAEILGRTQRYIKELEETGMTTREGIISDTAITMNHNEWNGRTQIAEIETDRDKYVVKKNTQRDEIINDRNAQRDENITTINAQRDVLINDKEWSGRENIAKIDADKEKSIAFRDADKEEFITDRLSRKEENLATIDYKKTVDIKQIDSRTEIQKNELQNQRIDSINNKEILTEIINANKECSIEKIKSDAAIQYQNSYVKNALNIIKRKYEFYEKMQLIN